MNQTPDEFISNLKNKVLAGTPIIQVISFENQRLEGMIKLLLQKYLPSIKFYRWSVPNNMEKYDKEEREFVDYEGGELITSLKNYSSKNDDAGDHFDNSILLIKDIQHFFREDSQMRVQTIAHLRQFAEEKYVKRTIVLVQPALNLPIELSKSTIVMELNLPSENLLKSLLEISINEVELNDEVIDKESKLSIAKAALGLTYQEALQTFRELIVRNKKINAESIPFVISRKEQIIKQNGVLEYFHPKEGFADVGGLEKLKEWLIHRQKGFTAKANEFGLQPPKGVLLLGIPGGGKSLIAKSIASSWQLPLLKFDISRVFGGIVGESEANIRKAIEVANTIAPAILWIDEIEKGLSGVGSSDQTDGGVTSRIFGTLLTWMQEKEKPVFVIATANDVTKLPPELLRKGRFDEIFFVDLPGDKSREEIWKIHLKRRLKSEILENIDYRILVEKSVGYTGAEIEGAVNEGLYIAFGEDTQITTDVFTRALKDIFPLSKVRFEDLEHLRNWAIHRARMASDETGAYQIDDKTKKIPKLKSEENLDMWAK